MQNLQILLDDLTDTGTLQLHIIEDDEKKICLIPYVMNDALENYIYLEGVRIQGTYNKGDTIIANEVIEADKGIIFTKNNEEIFTLWYDNFEIVLELYRFHDLGHFWKRGEDQWRRLNYVIGTIYDKLKYIGADACNTCEKRLFPLLGFKPFRAYSPIEESFDIFYEKEELENLQMVGNMTMCELAKEAGCKELWELTYEYMTIHVDLERMKVLNRKSPFGKLKRARLIKRYEELSNRIYFYMMTEDCWPLYNKIIELLEDGMAEYKPRSYSKEDELKHQAKRDYVIKELQSKGYEGEYPVFSKGDVSVRLVEEHPYVQKQLEYEGFDFNIYGMKSRCVGYTDRIDGGFFIDKEKKNKSSIIEFF